MNAKLYIVTIEPAINAGWVMFGLLQIFFNLDFCFFFFLFFEKKKSQANIIKSN